MIATGLSEARGRQEIEPSQVSQEHLKNILSSCLIGLGPIRRINPMNWLVNF